MSYGYFSKGNSLKTCYRHDVMSNTLPFRVSDFQKQYVSVQFRLLFAAISNPLITS